MFSGLRAPDKESSALSFFLALVHLVRRGEKDHAQSTTPASFYPIRMKHCHFSGPVPLLGEGPRRALLCFYPGNNAWRPGKNVSQIQLGFPVRPMSAHAL
ncbi:hypothetical protein XENOCAPTIV_011954 [Xenoophorus captivus]|uniref:Uncharacterized protein n=1 Tax=Xenoophorus captivus TaxID=1517983 RepID=A0ABV0SES9_9TELE